MAPKRPRLIVIAGPNGSGKTSITLGLREHAWMSGCEYINPDVIAFQRFGGWSSPNSFFQAADEAEKRREACLANQRDFAFETVLSTSEKVRFIQKAVTAGYFVRFFFICTNNPAINTARIAQRAVLGEHLVPEEKIIARFPRSIAQAAQIVPLIDRAYIYDNSVEDADPRLLFRTVDGRLQKQYGEHVNVWALPIVQVLRKE